MARNLEVADIQQQYEFIQIALFEMQQAYLREIIKSRQAIPASDKKKQKLRRWQHATQAFINELDNYLMLLDSHVYFSLAVNRQQKILIIIDSRPMIINGPNYASHKRMEQNIVQQFCQLHNCSYYLDSNTLAYGLTAGSFYNDNSLEHITNSSGIWLFSSENGPIYMTGQGINCEFNNTSNRKLKAAACESLAGEVTRLAKALQEAEAAGHNIDSEFLALHSSANNEMLQIIINQQGKQIKQSLPLLQKHPELFSEIRPWFMNDSDEQPPDIEISRAERLLK